MKSRFVPYYLVLVFLAPATLIGQEVSPAPRNQPVMTYMEALEGAILFGGFVNGQRQNDTWLWNGQWKEIQNSKSPVVRSGHAMAYDRNRNVLVLFGGKGENGILADTWEFDGKEWKLISTGGPPPRQSHRIVYAPFLKQMILFGGSDQDGNSLSDTWTLTTNGWRKLEAVIPEGRLQFVMASLNDRLIVQGGFSRKDGTKKVHGDTWSFDGNQWTQIATQGPGQRDHHAMIYDPTEDRLVLFGGYNQTYKGDTWQYVDEGWSLINNNGPERAGKPSLFYDKKRNRITLFGGWDHNNKPLSDFHYLSDGQWKRSN